ncbi:aspartate ammonia-lyase [Acinetobacter sp. ANC 4945]|uniref:Aspartate ammonia-lyase n=1 Tax=Acinetobacter amyesii TaxID=2942470 RepID=A0A1T1GYB7_9GAMM|nr:aspartate ammonia-lyase [Acinetobacter amyesii]MCL6246658.1 aspartate ammonia-lyase [Acinetobacter amyesii]OOV82609.1 aspartate ammonia-lyase [Acinetobacter amyesii]
MQTRIEHDLLGAKEVPVDAYYGIHTLRAIENFQISNVKIGQSPHFIRALGFVKKAAAQTNFHFQRISAQQLAAIEYGADQLIEHPEKWAESFPIDVYQGGAGTSVNMNCNEVIANIGLEFLGLNKGNYRELHPNDHVNKSQSTNDVYPTALRISLYQRLDDLLQGLTGLVSTIRLKADEYKFALKMGRTQLQDAVPMTVGQEFSAFATLLNEDLHLIDQMRQLLLEINLGATAIGTGVNSPVGYAHRITENLSQLTGLSFKGAEDYIEATSDCGVFIIISSTLKRLACKLSKICNDLRLLSSGPRTGLAEIRLPELQAGSSIMPAKVNPVIPEVVNQIAFKVMGNDLTITMAAEAGQLQLNVMEPVIALSLNESIQLLVEGIHTLNEKCFAGIQVNEQQAYDMVMRSVGIVTLLDPILGHERCDAIGKQCIAENKTIQEVVLSQGLMTEQELQQVFSFENLITEVKVSENLQDIA